MSADLSTGVILLVLCSALVHAGWNTFIKIGADPFMNTVAVIAGCGMIAGVALPFLDQPVPESWPFIATSAVLQVVYFVLLAAAYRAGDFGQASPLMRGTAPLLVALTAGPLIGEALSPLRWAGVVLISGGVLVLASDGGFTRAGRTTVLAALANAVVIAGYTLVDGTGVRMSGAPVAYTMWIFLLTAAAMVSWAAIRRPRDLVHLLLRRFPLCLVGGAATGGSYGLALLAMTMAPVALVAALRETSIAFAAVIAVVFLKEPATARRLVSAGIIAFGAVVIRLG